ncbi:MAG: caspase family protein [Pseudomonadota bacterium]
MVGARYQESGISNDVGTMQAREELRREDLLVVYFSGHGTRAWDGTRWHRYLLARDSRTTDLDGTAIDLDVLQDFLPLLAPERKALIVDACFQGDGESSVQPTERELTEEAVASFVARPTAMSAGEARLFATTPGRPAREDDELGHGVYTYYLLEALSWSLGGRSSCGISGRLDSAERRPGVVLRGPTRAPTPPPPRARP